MSTAAPLPDTTTTRPLTLRDRLLGWREILETANPPEHRPLDTVGKWLVITRAAVFPMTIWSGLIGGLLAVEAARTKGGAPVDWGLFLLAVVGLVLAHAANNMINDYFDTSNGVDTEGYVRALYAPHPILSGWVTKRQLELAILAVLAWILRSLIVAPFSIPSGSMLPTMMIGDYLFVSKWPYGYSRASFPFGFPSFDGRIFGSTPERGDIVVFCASGGGINMAAMVFRY